MENRNNRKTSNNKVGNGNNPETYLKVIDINKEEFN